MIRRFALLAAPLVALVLVGCEPPGASSAAPSAPPGPPPPPGTSPSTALEVAPAGTGSTDIAPTSPNQNHGGDALAETDSTVNETQLSAAEAPAPAPATPPAPDQIPANSGNSAQFISLSAGVAVPQLLPEGTQVGVSVDYSLRGAPRTSCQYFLVVESSAGETAVPVKLETRGGTFQGFLPLSVRPEHQPFRARIEEAPPVGERVRVSNSAPLATSY